MSPASVSIVPRSDGPRVPNHVAIVMDGNGRWATARGLPRPVGHLHGVQVATRMYRACRAAGVRHLTLYGFSVANWNRPPVEVETLMKIFADYASSLRDDFIARGIRFQVIGDIDRLPEATRDSLRATSESTADQEGMVLSLALSYGGRTDLLRATRALVARAAAGELTADEVDDDVLREHMCTAGMPDPDLLIRTGGELRLSDFLVFESAYAELRFSDVLWPDFDEDDLAEAFADFAGRERRYGRVGRAAAPSMMVATGA
ncbi:MAG: polyprenyl diphosphate synthase [Nannocystaceae bacterium]